MSRCRVHDDRNRAETGATEVRRKQCLLLPAGFAVRGAGLFAGAPAEASGARGERVLAQPAAPDAPIGSIGCGGECAGVGPLAAKVSALSRSSASRNAERRYLPGAKR